MEIRFVTPDLRALDGLRCEALALPIFQDERPLRGAAGLADWRLCGRISRLLLRGRVRGTRGERVLLPARPRLPFEKLFLFGLGERAAFDESVFATAMHEVLETLADARARTACVALPGRTLELLTPERALELFLGVVAELGPTDASRSHDELVLIEHHDAQRAMSTVLEHARRRQRAAVEG